MPLKRQHLCAAGAELRRAVFEPPRGEHDVYMLKMPGSPPTWVPVVHAEPVLAERFRAGEVMAFDLHRLEQNGPAMRALRAQPQSLICGVRLNDGSLISGVPPCLMPIRRTYALRAAAVSSLLASAFSWERGPRQHLRCYCRFCLPGNHCASPCGPLRGWPKLSRYLKCLPYGRARTLQVPRPRLEETSRR